MICKEFGWDFYTYDAQPYWFIEELILIMNQVAEKEKRDADIAQQDAKAQATIR